MALGGRGPGLIHRGESSGPRASGGGDAGRRSRTRRGTGGGREAAGGARARRPEGQKPPVLGPRKRRREMPTSGKPAAEYGGGDTEWKAKWRRRRRPSAKGRARSPRPSRRAALARGSPPSVSPRPSPSEILGVPGRGSDRLGPALWPAVAVQETRSVAGRSGAGVTGGAPSLHRSPSWRGGGRPGPRPSPLAGLQGLLRTGGPTRPGAGLTWLVAWT